MAPVCHAVINKFANFKPSKAILKDVVGGDGVEIISFGKERLPRHDWLASGRTPDCFGSCQWRGGLQIAGREVNGVIFGLRSSFEQFVIGCKADIFFMRPGRWVLITALVLIFSGQMPRSHGDPVSSAG